MTEALIAKLGYVGIALILVLGGLGLPVPEEAPIILAAVLSKSGRMWWPFALSACFVGVLVGDFIVYFIGYYYGEKVMSLPMTRKLLTAEREAQIKGYFHRHGFKILILGRFAVGFRTAAYLTAGILELPVLKLFLTDVLAASLSTLLMFGLGYVFAHQLESSFDQMKHWVMAIVALTLASWALHRFYKGRQRAGLRVGPPVLVNEDAPLPPDDLQAHPDPPTRNTSAVPTSAASASETTPSVSPPPVSQESPSASPLTSGNGPHAPRKPKSSDQSPRDSEPNSQRERGESLSSLPRLKEEASGPESNPLLADPNRARSI